MSAGNPPAAPDWARRVGAAAASADVSDLTRLAVPPDRLHELPGTVDPRTA